MKLQKFKSVVICSSLLFGSAQLYAKKKKQSPSPAKKTVLVKQVADNKLQAQKAQLLNERFTKLMQLNKEKKISALNLWINLDEIGNSAEISSLSLDNKILLNQERAVLLQKAKYPILASFYASSALRLTLSPLSPVTKPSWEVLATNSKNFPIQYVLEDLAQNLQRDVAAPPYFGGDWNYIRGNAFASLDKRKAIVYFSMLKPTDRYYLSGLYQTSMLEYDENRINFSIKALEKMISKDVYEETKLSANDKLEIWNYANLALGRVYYEKKDFLNSVNYFRKVTKESPLFYDALFEQSWALFMSGNPSHALGSLYGVASPFFPDKFNPEAKLLESIIYYWLCRYDDASVALVEFGRQNSKDMESIRNFLKSQQLTAENTYEMFEDLVSGVSQNALPISKRVLKTAAENDSMLLLRDQLATLVDEENRLKNRGIFGSRKAMGDTEKLVELTGKKLKKAIGEQLIVELKAIKTDFDNLYEQSQFLYLELLMSEKEKLMGGELHSSTKVTSVSKNVDIVGWARRMKQSWMDDKGEFWWDEIGFQIIAVKPECSIK